MTQGPFEMTLTRGEIMKARGDSQPNGSGPVDTCMQCGGPPGPSGHRRRICSTACRKERDRRRRGSAAPKLVAEPEPVAEAEAEPVEIAVDAVDVVDGLALEVFEAVVRRARELLSLP